MDTANNEIKDIYYLSPMQEGILYHYLMDKESPIYFEQNIFAIKGEIDIKIFERSLEIVAARHDSLRTVFVFEEVEKPLQVVLKENKVEIDFRDISRPRAGEDDTAVKLNEIMEEDRRKGFDLSKAGLMRVTVVKTSVDEYRLIWSFHHIIMDGWCIGIIAKEIFKVYAYIRRHNGSVDMEAIAAELGEVYSYGNYIKWLESRDKEGAKEFWRKYLEGYKLQAGLPQTGKSGVTGSYIPGELAITIDESVIGKLNEIGRKNQATLNTLMQVIWGIVLQKYNNIDDVVFGYVVSGRPPELEGIENMVGLFINTVPVRIKSNGDLKFDELVRQTQAELLNAKRHEHLSLVDIQAGTDLKQGLVDHIMVFENYPVEAEVKNAGEDLGFKIEGVEVFEQTNYDFGIIVIPGKEIKLALRYNESVYERDMIERVAGHIRECILNITNKPDIMPYEIEILAANEKQQLLYAFNDTAADYPADKTIHRLFEEQAEKTPDNICVIFEEQRARAQLTYKEINEKSNRLAGRLRDMGVKPDSIVGIMVERSTEMVVGIMAILKAGGAYLPVDPEYPGDRIKFILQDSGARILLTQKELLHKIDVEADILDLKDENLYGGDNSNLKMINTPRHLAYVIYTSGTTGAPKGVMIEHKGISNTIQWRRREYKFDCNDSVLQLFSYSFDGFLTSFFTPLVSGAKVIFPKDARDSLSVKNCIVEHKVTHFISIPALYTALLESLTVEDAESLRIITLAGDKSTPGMLEESRRKFPWVELVNEYGPSENSVATTIYRNLEANSETLIGKPVANTMVYILGNGSNLQPVGVAGELCISGIGLARGYLNKPELTDEKFIPNPFYSMNSSNLNNSEFRTQNSELIYKTGDLARWLPDGNIEFLGRMDHQVKIRGYRIELGEIEARLLKYEGLKEAVVIDREDRNGNKYLCAYFEGIVPESSGQISPQKLRTFLLKTLPEYMIPAYFVKIDKLPLTANGKIDRKALADPGKYPDPDGNIYTGAQYEAPANDTERKLVEIWQEVLGLEKVGVNDSFFDLGGDSIKAIQVASRLNKYDMKLEIKDLFANPRIKELEKYVNTGVNPVNQEVIEGETPLAPIQRWFFGQEMDERHYFNQAVMLYGKNGFDEDLIRKTFTAIVAHHDALRMVYRMDGERLVQYNRGLAENLFDLKVLDLIDEKEYAKKIAVECERIQSSINLGAGPLVKLGLFKTAAGDHLLIAIHHLVIDGVSWRILLEDLALGYEQAKRGETIKFQDKTASYREWATKLNQYASSEELQNELNYWKEIAEIGVSPLKKDYPDTESSSPDSSSTQSSSPERSGARPRVADSRIVSFELEETATRKLLKNANHAYRTEINDLLLTALGMAVKEYTGEERILITLEGHGREGIIEGIDISRTVGWFTSIFPVVLDLSYVDDIAFQIKTVKETLREIPRKGIGFGVLKYLTDAGKKPAFKLQPELSFNYLGQFDSDLESDIFARSGLDSGASVSNKTVRQHAIDINGMIVGGKLAISLSYNNKEYKESTIQNIANNYLLKLQGIIGHCAGKNTRALTPSDLSSKGISIRETDEIYRIIGETCRGEIQDIYYLTPMQEGMLFHYVLDRESIAYFEQNVFTVKGEIDKENFERSLAIVTARHDILRTVFVFEKVKKPVQVVLRERVNRIDYEDISAEKDKEAKIKEIKERDQNERFNLATDSLIRVKVIKVGKEDYRLIWSFHHIIMDGWCIGIIAKEIFTVYARLKKSDGAVNPKSIDKELGETYAYGNYIKWLENRNREEAKKYWEKYLEGYGQRASLPQTRKSSADDARAKYIRNELDIIIEESVAHKLNEIGRENRATLNTLVQVIWGVLLQKYNNTNDVVFGYVVSGRPPEIKGIEIMIGLFINTIPVRITDSNELKFDALVRQTQAELLNTKQHEHLSLAEIQTGTELKQGLIDHIMIYENYPLEIELQNAGMNLGLKIEGVEVFEQTNYDLNITVLPGKEILVKIQYNETVYERDMIERLAGHLREITLNIAKNPFAALSEIKMLSAPEKRQLLYEFNNTASEYPRDNSIPRLFEEQVEKTPDNIAVVYEDRQLTCRELNEKANRLARALRGKGIKPDSIVGIMVERSLEMIIGIIGILKAGGAYLPVDPEYPAERVKFMLKDSNTRLILTQSRLTELLREQARVLDLEVLDLNNTALYDEDASNLPIINQSGDLAYVMYTSGSTGQPKGVLVEHRNIIRLVKNTNYVEFNKEDRILQTGAIVFDATTFEFWGALLNGLRLFIVDETIILDAEQLGNALKTYEITTLWLTSPLFNQLASEDPSMFKGLKNLIVGGDVLAASHINNVRRKCKDTTIINGYGPTENTTFSVCFKIDRDFEENIPIGRPVSNSTAYIVDKNNNPQPIGVPGELLVGGDGVARGYLNRPDLTAEKFIPNPFVDVDASQGTRLPKIYKTGDLARWLPDGNIEFLGRIDHQVKIRGFRIELEEIEAQLLKHEGIKETVVIAREDNGRHKYLCAYFVPSSVKTFNETSLRTFLLKVLPEYMIPSYFVMLDKLPLNTNGKIDRKALADPSKYPGPESVVGTDAAYEAPVNAIEEKLAGIWQEVLGIEKVGVTESFFELGGDSIKAIQVAARLNKYDMKLEIKDLFANPTIRESGKYVKINIKSGNQGVIEGEIPLAPVQKWFFGQEIEEKHYFNQAVMLYGKDGFDEAVIRKTFTAIIKHHDALRMVYRTDGDRIVQYNRGNEGVLFDLKVIDLRDERVYEEKVTEECGRIQNSIDLSAGPLVKLGLFKTVAGDHLLIAIHHLVVDGVSWRILLEDLASGYEQAKRGEEIRLQDKTDSYREWAIKLNQYAASKDLQAEAGYWRNLAETGAGRLKKEYANAESSVAKNCVAKNCVAESSSAQKRALISFELSEAETRKLLKDANRAYHTEINDILLTALGMAFKEYTGEERVLITLEGHGREEIIQGIDLSRTVGWFTSIFPVVLDLSYVDDISFQIKTIKESLRAIPRKGIGYGILKYLTNEGKRQEFNLQPELSFNYLGQFDSEIENDIFKTSELSPGAPVSKKSKSLHAIAVNGMVVGGRLAISMSFNSEEYKESAIQNIAQNFQQHLLEIIGHCAGRATSELTPSDLSSSGISIQETGAIYRIIGEIDQGEIQDIYYLTPMQEGMLFHYMMDRKSAAYFEQNIFTIKGEIHKGLFERSLEKVASRHDILRTVFVFEGVKKPVQVVLKERTCSIDFEDISARMDKEAKLSEIKARDRRKGFNLAKDRLMRVTLVKAGNSEYRLIWSFHHIIMDGWCIGIIAKEIFRVYAHLRQNNGPINPAVINHELGETYAYGNYIKWQESRDREEAKKYWEEYLDGYEQKAELPQIRKSRTADEYVPGEFDIIIEEPLSNKLNEIGQRNQATLNTLMQVVWGVLLQKYNSLNDVVFGYVVSGRPPEIKGIENMVGLFINTVPVRVKGAGELEFDKLVSQVQMESLNARRHEHVSLVEIQAVSELKQGLIDHIMIFENYPVEQELRDAGDSMGFTLEGSETFEQTNYDFDIIVMPGKELKIVLRYNESVYEKGTVERLAGHIREITLKIAEKPGIMLKEIEMLTAGEKRQLLYEFNNTAAEYPKDKTIQRLFEEQAEKTPDNVAVVCNDKQLTYRELNAQANNLAKSLQSKGVGPDSIVAIMVERSPEMVTGALGVLKAGGAYLPIDPEYPEERIRFMLNDSQARILLTRRRLAEQLKVELEIVYLDNENSLEIEAVNPTAINTPHDLAYVIYTSGTTGMPKGAMIEHHNVVRLLFNEQFQFAFSKDDVWTMFHSFCFDFSVWEMYGALLYGGKLIVVPKIIAQDPGEYLKLLKNEKVTVLNQTPTAFYNLVHEELSSLDATLALRYVIFGGEALKPVKLKEWKDKYPDVKLINMYGITETTVHVTYKEITDYEIEFNISNIGKPIPTLTAYVMDRKLELLPIGAPGELCVGGEGVCRGYLNRPELTAERFAPNPYRPEERLYRSGDLVKLLPDGEMEYLGRIDHQVKIRGHRIELGEIESRLLKHETVQEAVVIDKEDRDGNKYLCAYIVARNTHACSLQELRTFLLKTLPEYMIPGYFVKLAKLPLTPNGKIDRKALDGYGKDSESGITINIGVEYEAPANMTEEKLVEIWREVLGTEKIGTGDSFFELGGDSIKAIQVAARLNKYEMKLEIKDLFAYPRIKELAQRIKTGAVSRDQSVIEGETPLTPIQRWFFDLETDDRHHFNQAVMLYGKDGFDETAIRKTFTAIATRHDALRMVYRMDGERIIQYNRGIDGNLFDLSVMDLSEEKDYAKKLEEECERLQGSMNLSAGPLLKLGLFKTAEGDHLLIAIHHLVIDGVSWRILLEDLTLGYGQAQRGQEITFQDKTDAYREWAIKLNQYANSDEPLTEADYWRKIAEAKITRLKRDYVITESINTECSGAPWRVGDSRVISFELDETQTGKLLKDINRAYNTEINDLLLTALGVAVKEYTGENKVLVALEGHGREEIIAGIDISRTVGWFTSLFPVILDMSHSEDLARQIKTVKEDLRKIPHKGIDYGILKYLTAEGISAAFKLQPEISFNYLGQFDNEIESEFFAISKLNAGPPASKKFKRQYALDVNGMVIGGRLVISLSSHKEEYKESTIRKISECLQAKLNEIIDFCAAKQIRELTPSDFSSTGISIRETEEVYKIIKEIYRSEIQDIYYLTPLQEGMLFHYIMDRDSGAYFEQHIFAIKGELDMERFKRSLAIVSARHDILRTVFIFEGVGRPLQVVLRDRPVRMDFVDITNEKDREAKCKEIKERDKKDGFDLVKDNPMRVTIVKASEGEFRVIWSFHHIIMDGWCIGIIAKEIFEVYARLMGPSEVDSPKTIESVLGETYAYGSYVKWLENRDRESAFKYWEKYLEDYEQPAWLTPLKKRVVTVETRSDFIRSDAIRSDEIRYLPGEIDILIEAPVIAKLNAIGQANQVTLNTIMQVIWGILLQKYNNVADVVFGYVVSGRPPEIKGIEKMVGLFINTVPARIKCGGEQKFADIIRQIQKDVLNSKKHEHLSLAEIQAGTELKQGLIDHIMIFENYPIENAVKNSGEVLGFTIEGIEDFEQTNYDFNIVIIPGKEIKFGLRFNEALFEKDMLLRLTGHIREIIQCVTAQPDIAVRNIEILTPEEKNRLLYEFNDNAARYLKDKTIMELFQEQAARMPEKTALIYEEKQLTYGEINDRANRLARLLRVKGVKPDTVTAILTERSLEMIIGVMAVLKAGSAYLPVNPAYPDERINFMLRDSKAVILLTQTGLASSLCFEGEIVALDNNTCLDLADSNPEIANKPSDLAYIIYTSGTTGNPKGVMVEHGSFSETIQWRRDEYRLNSEDNVLQLFSFAFDGFITSFFTPVISGSQIVLLSEDGAKNPLVIKNKIIEHRITHFICIPVLFAAVLDCISAEEAQSLRIVTLAGEKLSRRVIEQSREKNSRLEIVNEYGPTESTVVSSISRNVGLEGDITIGKPVTDTSIYILDKNGAVQPVGIAGEICIAGGRLARGYLNRPDLTAEKFAPTPFLQLRVGHQNKLASYELRTLNDLDLKNSQPETGELANLELSNSQLTTRNPQLELGNSQLMYKTGDYGRWLSDGNIEFLGRLDHQVKIRGFRIELAEIENWLCEHESVKEAVVIDKEDQNAQKYLCAYIVPAFPGIDEFPVGTWRAYLREIRAYLSQKLPDYMIPAYFVRLEKMPLTSNGKIDRKALPGPEESSNADAVYEAPANETEAKLVGLWKEVLGTEKIGINDNFFAIGGHSLKAAILIARIHQQWHVSLPLKEIFAYPTVKELARQIKESGKSVYSSITPVAGKEYYHVSSAQKRLHALNQFEETGTSYNIPNIMFIEGQLDRRRFDECLKKLIARHESFRTSFKIIDGMPVQQVHEKVDFAADYMETDESRAPEIISSFIRPFDLSKAPLLRVKLLKTKEDRHLMLCDMHHIIADGTSFGILVREFIALYNGQELPALRIQYKDFSEWQNGFIQSEVIKNQENYWLDTFKGEIPVLNLPTDYQRPLMQSFAGSNVFFETGEEIRNGLAKIAAKTGATMYMVLLAAYNVLLTKYTGQEDIVVGSPIAGRRHADLENIVGMFVNTLAMRNYPDGNKTFLGFLEEVKQNSLQAYENQDYQFEELLEKLEIIRDTSRNPLFDVMFALQNMDMAQIDTGEIKFRPYEFSNPVSKFDITLYAFETRQGFQFNLEYSVKLFKKDTIERVIGHFLNILNEIVDNPALKLSEIQMLTPEEKKRILLEFNNTKTDYPKDKTLPELFAEQAAKRPDCIAIVFEDKSLTYGELNKKAGNIAKYLREKGIGRDCPVGIMVERSLEMMIGIIGILKSGGAYLPVDPEYPEERIRFMLEDAKIKLLLTQAHLKERFDQLARALAVEAAVLDNPGLYVDEVTDLKTINKPGDLAYIMYTSGSTGKPKGVLVEHRSIIRLIRDANYIEFNEEDRILQTGAIVFDATTFEFWGALLNGLRLYIVNEAVILNAEKLKDALEKYKITILWLTAPLFNQLSTQDPSMFKGLKYLLVGGDVLSTAHINTVRRICPNTTIINGYGPTENTTFSVCFKIERDYAENIPIGKPISNSTAYIVDKFNNLQPVGVPGELLVGSDGVARGYLNRPELTEEKFIRDLFHQEERIYKTGDLARWLPDGTIEFLGRADQQVKIRGFRVEPGEVENQLLKYETIKEAAVIVKTDKEGNKYLCAYIVRRDPAGANECPVAEIREYLSNVLPAYMIPSYFMDIDHIPLTVNGKIDRKALPEPGDSLAAKDAYVAPANEIEDKLAQIWQELLETEKIGVTDNFFELGGHSLKATTLTSKIHKEFNVELALREIFKAPTIREMAATIESASNSLYVSLPATPGKDYYPLSAAQKRMYILNQMEKEQTNYNMPFAVKIEGHLNRELLDSVIQKLAQRHESFRTSFAIVKGEAAQHIYPEIKISVAYMEAEEVNVEDSMQNFIRPFDVSQAPLLRVGLIKLGENRHILLYDMHHIISDGTSMGILLREFIKLYNGELLPELRIQYKDFAEWQSKLFQTELIKKQEEYWLNRFAGEIPVLNLPTDLPRPAVLNFQGDQHQFEIGAGLTAKLKQLAKEKGFTLFTVILAAYNVLLSKLTGQEDIIIGIPVAGRGHADLRNIIGMFINTVAMRNFPQLNRSFTDFLEDVADNALKAFENQDYQFEMLLEKLEIKRDPSRNPLFDITINYLNMDTDDNSAVTSASSGENAIQFTTLPIESKTAKFDLVYYFTEQTDTIMVRCNYRTSLFKKKTIEYLAGEYCGLLEEIVADPGKKLKEYPVLTRNSLQVKKNRVVPKGNYESFEDEEL